ncbi:MAG: hypothetical protein RMK52_09140 [Chitinophagales bacterium]|nr:hypothetical protein [Chitinophagales bacterium]MDW8394393.1 hypothetical protein [Chitinophagales bacterium]
MQRLICVGRVNRAFGLKGHLRFYLLPPYRHRLPDTPVFFLTHRQTLLPFETEEFDVTPSGHGLLLLQGIRERTQAQQFVGQSLMVEASCLKAAPEVTGPAAWLGYNLHDEQVGPLGPLEDVLLLPQHALGLFRFREKEVLFPLHEHFLLGADHERRVLFVRLPDGLLDLYAPRSS